MSRWFGDLAGEDFSRARTREFLSSIATFLGSSRHKLLPFDEVRALLRPMREVYEGLKAVDLSLIVGSEGRYRDFNRHFLPKHEYLRSRWVSIDKAHYEEVPLPPIRLYEIGGLYFVRDGNHRVSVAALRGQTQIDAEVTSLDAEIRLEPGMTIEELKSAVIAWEKKEFYEKTSFAGLTGDNDLDFTSPGRYDEILEHINVHKYFINQSRREELPYWQAVVSWYSNVYQPISVGIVEMDLLARFPDRTVSDLYVFVVRHWDELKKKYGVSLTMEEATKDYRERFGTTEFARIRNFFSDLRARLFKGTKRPPKS
jgi:hypothetical protein